MNPKLVRSSTFVLPFFVLFIVIMLYLKRIFKCKNKEMLELAPNGLHSLSFSLFKEELRILCCHYSDLLWGKCGAPPPPIFPLHLQKSLLFLIPFIRASQNDPSVKALEIFRTLSRWMFLEKCVLWG